MCGPCASGYVCQDGACVWVRPAPVVPLGELGRYTRVAPLTDGRLAVATWDRTHTALVVLFVDPMLGPGFGLGGASQADVHVVGGFAKGDGQQQLDADSGRWCAIDAAENEVHLAWFERGAGELRYTHGNAAQGFGTDTLVDGGGPSARGTHVSLAVDGLGVVHVAYRDETERRLRYARREVDGRWRTSPIDACAGEVGCPAAGREDYGEFAALALVPAAGGGALPRIAFYDRFRGDLKIAAQAPAGDWVSTTIAGRDPATGADAGDVGQFVSIAATPTRQLGVAYVDVSAGALVYLAPGGAPRVVDAGIGADASGRARHHAVGAYVRLGYDLSGRAHMLYADMGALTLKRALVRGEAAPELQTLPTAPGGWIDFRVGDDGALVGAYGAFVPDAAPQTELVLFSLEAP